MTTGISIATILKKLIPRGGDTPGGQIPARKEKVV